MKELKEIEKVKKEADKLMMNKLAEIEELKNLKTRLRILKSL